MKCVDSLNIGVPLQKPGTQILCKPPSALPAAILDAMIFWSGTPIADGRITNKVGAQYREGLSQNSAVGQIWPGMANLYNGIDQASFVADNGDLDINQASTDFCIEGFITTGSDIITAQYLFGKNIGGAVDGRYGFTIVGGTINLTIASSGGLITASDNITLEANTEYHLLGRIDLANNKIYFYIDNVLQNVGGTSFIGTFSPLANVYEFYLGAGNDSTGAIATTFFGGQLRDIRIYHKDVSGDIASLMKGERLGDEIAWYWCEGKDLLEDFDASGNGYHLTNLNFDSNVFVEGMWQNISNKFGYAINVDDRVNMNVSNCINNDYTTFANAMPTGFEATSDGVGVDNAGTADEISFITSKKYLVEFDLVLNSGTPPVFDIGENPSVPISDEGNQLAVIGSNSFIFTSGSTVIGSALFANIATTTDFEVINLKVQRYYNTAIPPDMSTTVNGVPTHDIFGNVLLFSGQAKYNAISRDRNCFIGDGSAYWNTTNDISFADGDTMEFNIVTPATVGAAELLVGEQSLQVDFLYIAPLSVLCRLGSVTKSINYTFDPSTNYQIKYERKGGGSSVEIYINDVSVGILTGYTTTPAIFNQFSARASALASSLTFITAIKTGSENYQFCEGQGNTVYDVSQTDGNTLTGVNVDNNNWCVIDTPDEDYLATRGANFVGQFNGVDDYLTLPSPIIIDLTKTTVISFNSDSALYVLGNSVTSSKSYILFPTVSSLRLESDSSGDIVNFTLNDNINGSFYDYEITIVNKVVTAKQNGVSLVGGGTFTGTFLTFDQIGRAGTTIFYDGKIASLSIIEDGVDLFNKNITGLNDEIDGGTWLGTGIHTAIIPGKDNDSRLDALGQSLVYPQSGANLIPQTYFAMPENIWELYIGDQEVRWEEVTIENADFEGSSGWSLSGGWSIIGGQLVGTAATGDTFQLLSSQLSAGDEIKVIFEVTERSLGGAAFTAYGGGALGASRQTTGVFIEDFILATPNGNYGFADSGGAFTGKIGWIRIYKKVSATGNNLISNGGVRNDIGALIISDWIDSNSDGLADDFIRDNNGSDTIVNSIVTGNGFSGNVQKVEITNHVDSTFTRLYQNASVNYISGRSYYYRLKYRSSSDIQFRIADSFADKVILPLNTGDAIEASGIITLTGVTNQLAALYMGLIATNEYIEIDEFEIRPIIDGEFYEPLAIGGNPVVVQTDYFYLNPVRYLVRYFNPCDWKDLILFAVDNTLTYDDHLIIKEFTCNEEEFIFIIDEFGNEIVDEFANDVIQ